MEYLDVLENNYNSFPCMDQGILSLMVFKALDAGLVVAKQAHLQTVVPVHSPVELSQRFLFRNGHPVVSAQPTVIHWAGPKPYVQNMHLFATPMYHFRTKGMVQCGLPGWAPPGLAMRLDEFRCRSLPRLIQRLKARLKVLMSRRG
jgi:hypothetical protein